jgi:hypothetical protein
VGSKVVARRMLPNEVPVRTELNGVSYPRPSAKSAFLIRSDRIRRIWLELVGTRMTRIRRMLRILETTL